MKNYSVTYEKDGEVLSIATFKANTLRAARELAQNHKRKLPELKGKGAVKTIVTIAG